VLVLVLVLVLVMVLVMVMLQVVGSKGIGCYWIDCSVLFCSVLFCSVLFIPKNENYWSLFIVCELFLTGEHWIVFILPLRRDVQNRSG